jgi:hypothetical protein
MFAGSKFLAVYAAVGEIELAVARDQARAWLEKLQSGTPPPAVKQRHRRPQQNEEGAR